MQDSLTGSYAVERELGGGGMSRVWLATETALDRRVVLKVLPPHLTHAISAERFRQEVRLAARLSHPHIVPLLTAGTAGELLYYSMPFIEGDSLRNRLQRAGELPVRDAVRLLRDVAAALTYAHDRGIVHRDIKPDNVLVAGGEALVTDFGIAKALAAAAGSDGHELTATGVVLGTPAYMAPEQAAADPQVDHRVDIYAWGCLAYECLTGQPPFAGRPASAQMAAHAVEQAQPLAQLRPAVPRALADLVDQCLAKRPADRPQQASELVMILEELAVSSDSATRHVRRSSTRASRAVLLVPALIVLTAAALGTHYFRTRQPSVPPSAKVIAILPFVPVSADTSLARLGRDLVVTIGANLDGVGDVRSVDPLRVLSNVKSSASVPSGPEAMALGQRLGALSVLQGTLVRSGGMVRADLSLVDGTGNAPLARVSATARTDDEGALTDSITWGLLRQIWRTRGAPTPLVSAVTTKSLPALRAYLEGSRFSSESRWSDASDAFDRAIRADSTFWLAYMGKQFVLGWSVDGQDDGIDSLLRAHRFELPERERLLVEAGMADSATQQLERLRAILVRWPDYSPAQWGIADALFHDGGFFGHTPAESAFEIERFLQLSPDGKFAWQHLLVALSRSRDTAAARRLLAERPQFQFGLWPRVCADLLIAPDSVARLRDSVLATIPNPANEWGDEMLAAFLDCNSPRGQLDYSRRALKRPLSPAGIRLHENFIALAWAMRGDWDSALVALDQLALRYSDDRATLARFRVAVAAAWLGGLDVRDARRRRGPEHADSQEERAEVWWMDGVLAYLDRDAAEIARARASVRASGASTARDLDRSLAALVTALQGDEAAAGRQLATLERERAQLSRNGNDAMLLTAIDRFAASRWLSARGDAQEGIDLLQGPTSYAVGQLRWILMNLTLLGPVALEEARLYEQAGRTTDARLAYLRFLELWDAPSPRMAHLVDEARSALARLPDVPAAR